MATEGMNAIYASQNITVKYAVRDAKNRFGNAAMCAVELGQNAFDSKPSHGYIGSDDNIISNAIAFTSNDYDIGQVAYGSNAAYLSSGSIYPDYTRVYASNGYEAMALADIVYTTFGWSRVVLIYTTNQYGTYAAQLWNTRARVLGITTIGEVVVTPGQATTELSQSILLANVKRLAALDARIWVLLCDDIPAVQNFWRLAQPILSIDTYFLGTSDISKPALFKGTGLPYDFINTTNLGYIGLQNADKDWKLFPRGQKFLARMKALTPTARFNAQGGISWCSDAKDNTERAYLYKVNLTSGGTACMGDDYSQYTTASLNRFAGFIYDAVRALTDAIVGYCKAEFGKPDGSFDIPDVISGAALTSYMVLKVGFPGVTGAVNFSVGVAGVPDYGWGDRALGIRYAVVNYNGTNGNWSGMVHNRIGTFTPERGFESCLGDPQLQGAMTGGCSPVIWNPAPGMNFKPSDRPDPVDQLMPPALKGYLTALTVLSFLATFVIVGLLLFYRKKRLLKASQLPMMWLVVCSLLYGCVRIALSTLDIATTGACVARYWLGHLAYTGIPALLAKTLRVHLIVNAKSMKKVKITTWQVVTFTAMLDAVLVVIMVFLTPLNRLSVHSYFTVEVNGRHTNFYACESNNWKLDFILYAYEMVLLLSAFKLCYDTRKVPDAVNEAPQIAKVIFTLSLVVAAAFSIIYILPLEPHITEVVIGTAFFLGVLAVQWYYFAPKLRLLLSGADLNHQFQIVNNSKPKDNGDGKVAVMDIQDEDDERDHIIQLFIPKMPKTLEDTRLLVEALQARQMILAQRATNGSNSGGSGSGGGFGSSSIGGSHVHSAQPSIADPLTRLGSTIQGGSFAETGHDLSNTERLALEMRRSSTYTA